MENNRRFQGTLETRCVPPICEISLAKLAWQPWWPELGRAQNVEKPCRHEGSDWTTLCQCSPDTVSYPAVPNVHCNVQCTETLQARRVRVWPSDFTTLCYFASILYQMCNFLIQWAKCFLQNEGVCRQKWCRTFPEKRPQQSLYTLLLVCTKCVIFYFSVESTLSTEMM